MPNRLRTIKPHPSLCHPTRNCLTQLPNFSQEESWDVYGTKAAVGVVNPRSYDG
jgi:hypothetical protein